MFKRSRLAAAIGLLLSLGSGCASRVATGAAPSSSETAPHEVRIPDWDQPFRGDNQVVDSFQTAENLVKGFQLYEPLGLGTPTIYLPTSNPPEAAILVFDTSNYGLVWVAESLPDIPDDSARKEAYEAMVEDNGQPYIHYTSEITSIRGNTTALVQYSDDQVLDPTVVEWVESGVQFQMLGPKLSRDQALEIANAI